MRGLVAVLCVFGLLFSALLLWLNIETTSSPELAGTDESSAQAEENLPISSVEGVNAESELGSEESSSKSTREAVPESASLEPELTKSAEQTKEPNPFTIRGRIELTDGTTVGGMELVAVLPEAVLPGRVLLQGKRSPEHLYSHTWTNKQGEFVFEFESEHLPKSFRIEQVNKRELGQSDRVYAFDPEVVIVHVVRGGQFSVQILSPSGDKQFGYVRVAASFRDPNSGEEEDVRSLASQLSEDGVARFFYRDPIRASLTAVRPEDGASGSLEEVFLDPTEKHRLFSISLVPLAETGRIKLSIVDGDGLPVVYYSVNLSSRGGTFGPWNVSSEHLGADGICSGLPIGDIEVDLRERFSYPPALYSTKGNPIWTATVSRDEQVEVRIQVKLETRIAIHIERSGELKPELGIRFRYVDDPEQQWLNTSVYFRYRDTVGMRFGGLRETGMYYSEVIREGQLDLELFDVLTDEVVWTGGTTVHNGTLTPIEVSL